VTVPQRPDARTSDARTAPSPSVAAETPPAAVTTSTMSEATSRRPSTRPAAPRSGGAGGTTARARRARLALKKVDPWSVFVFTLIAALLLGIALVAGVAALYAVLDDLGVQESVNEVYDELTRGDGTPIITSWRVVGAAAVLAAVNVVLMTLLATLGALLYNLCASFTGGIEVTLGEREA